MKKMLATLLLTSFALVGCTSSTQPTTSTTTDTTPTASTSPITGKIAGFTASDVAAHSSESDCWIIIDGKVYDVTTFLSRHEGGADVIIKECGKDASNAFHTMDGTGRDHPERAQSMLQTYYKGLLQ